MDLKRGRSQHWTECADRRARDLAAVQRPHELRAGAQGESPVALPTPRVRVSTEVHDCSMRLFYGAPILQRPESRGPRGLKRRTRREVVHERGLPQLYPGC